MRVCYFGGLDPYTGSTAQRRELLPALTRQLSCLCLFYDVVLLSPGNLLEHSLVLPACARLAPFVRAGRLGISGDPSSGRPIDYVEERAAKTLSRLGTGTRPSTNRAWRRSEIEELVGRWSELLPDNWTLTRSVSGQVGGFLDSVEAFCGAHRKHLALAEPILTTIDRARQAGRSDPDRNLLLAKIGTSKEVASPFDLGEAAALIQCSYFRMGLVAHQHAGRVSVCEHFPTHFLRRVHSRLGGKELFPEFPIAWKMVPERLRATARKLGIDLDRMLDLPADDLLALADSSEWRLLRDVVGAETLSKEAEREVAGIVRRFGELQGALSKLGWLSGCHDRAEDSAEAAPVFAPWQLVSQATLGSTLSGEATGSKTVVLFDLATRELSATSSQPCVQQLSRVQAQLLAVLTTAGGAGVGVLDVEALLTEMDVVESAELVGPPRRPPGGKRNNADVLKTTTNQLVAPFGLEISVGRVALHAPRRPPLHASCQHIEESRLGRVTAFRSMCA